MTEPDKEYMAKILDETKAVMDKYGLPKGIILVPDRLEISIKRNAYDSFHVSYKEYFEYLPREIVDIAIVNGINFLIQSGIPKERIERIANNGVGWELDGDAILAPAMVIPEFFIQKRFSEEETEQLLSLIKKGLKSFKELVDFEFEWNDEIATKFLKNQIKMGTIMEKTPSLRSELEAIPKKYTETIEKVRSILEKKEDETKPQ
jgi:hypothetical protein